MSFFKKNKFGWAVMLSVAVLAGGVSTGWARDSTAVEFVVNVSANVRAVPATKCITTESAWCPYASEQITVEGGEEAILMLPMPDLFSDVAYFGAQRRVNVPAIVSNRAGNVTVSLPAESYRNAEILLYTVNGKSVLRQKVSAANAADNVVSRPNIATGAYLLSVKGTDGKAIASRITHGGGRLDIRAVFGNGSENISAQASSSAKKAARIFPWTIKVSAVAPGYTDTAYVLNVTEETNPRQNITLRAVSGGDGDVDADADADADAD